VVSRQDAKFAKAGLDNFLKTDFEKLGELGVLAVQLFVAVWHLRVRIESK
jgi:hypothetical protein